MTGRGNHWVFPSLAMLAVMVLISNGQTTADLPAWKRPLLAARDRQDVAALRAEASISTGLDFRRALAYSYLSEVYLELGKKGEAGAAARQGVALARKAVESDTTDAKYRSLLGTLCGQVIPANPLSALSFGQCALDEIEMAIRLDPRLPEAYLARGVGNYYLPPAFGGGLEKAEADFRTALRLAPKWPDAHLWMGLLSRRQGNFAAAREHFNIAQRLSPGREWIRIQVEKTPGTPAK